MNLKERLESRQAQVAVIGLGYVGLPLAVSFAEAGLRVVGIEIDQKRLAALRSGHSYIADVPSERLASVLSRPRGLVATDDYGNLKEVDAVVICVPTPLSKTRDPDLSYIISATRHIAEYLHPGELVVLESTTYPGTTEEVMLPTLSAGGLNVGQEFFLAFSPERVDPGRKDWTVRNTPKVIGGVTPSCLEMASALYRCIVDRIVPVSSVRAAEMVKLLENTFRAVNIGLVNEVAIMCDHLGIDVWEVVEAAATKPFGFMAFQPGPGLGGHCIPIDPEYLAWKLRALNYTARFIELASDINLGMPKYVVDRLIQILNDEKKPLKGSHILVIGVAYKRNVGDVRDSPAIDVIEVMKKHGAEVSYHDPHVPVLSVDGETMCSVQLTEELLKNMDCTLIVTDHSACDWAWIVENSRLVLDTRNATKGLRQTGTRVVKL